MPSLRDADLLSQVHDAINATDADGILRTWNAGAERIYGYSAEEAMGKHVSMLLFPEDLPFLEKHVLRPLSAKDFHEIRVRNRRKDGTEIFVDLRLSVLRDAEGGIAYIIGCSNDITDHAQTEFALKEEIAERQRIEQALRHSEDRLKHVLRHSPAVVYSCKAQDDLNPTFVSESVSLLFGYPQEECLRTSQFWLGHIHPEDRDRVLSGVSQAIAAGNEFHAEYRFRHADGTYRWLRDTAMMVTDAAGKPVELVGQVMDVTWEKKAEEERREHQQLQDYAQTLLGCAT